MAKPDIQYVTYIHGSEARVLEFKPSRRRAKTALPQAAPEQKVKLYVDPVAIFGIMVAAVMVILMAVGIVQYMQVCEEHRVAMDQVVHMQNENIQLRQEYEAGYDLSDIETKALALGMIPRDQAEVIEIHAEMPVPETEPTWWEDLCWYFEGLFA